MKNSALLILLAIHIAGTACSFAGPIRAGAATANITPPLGIEMNGGTSPGYATHVHDELHARALVLDDGTQRLAFVLVDTCLLDRPVFDAAKALVLQHTGIPADHVSMSCTHTHSAGSACSGHLSEADPAYRRDLPGRMADAVRLAVNNLAPARLAWGSGTVPQHVFCRRVTVKPGVAYTNLLGEPGDRVKMNWSSPQPEVDGDFAGPVDPEVFVLSVQHADGRPLSLLANYSLHYVGGTGPGHLSADYFGAFCGRIAELLGAEKQEPPFVALMSNGTSGDINNNDFRKARPPQKPYEQINIVAGDVAQEVHRVVKTLTHRDDLKLSAASTELALAVRKPTPAEVERARAIVAGRDRRQQALFLISLVADKNHPIVAKVLTEVPRFEKTDATGKYILGRSDFADHPVYQTKWLKYGLRALGLPDPYIIPKVADSYGALFWMDFKDQHVAGKDSDDRGPYPYLGWACDHFHGTKKSPLSNRDYPLTWEQNASEANYAGLKIIGPIFAEKKISPPHTWHAAEAFLMLHVK